MHPRFGTRDKQISKLEMVQRRAARRILQDFDPLSSATALVDKLEFEPLQQRRTADKLTMMYKVMKGDVDLTPPPGLIQPNTRSTRGHQQKLRVPYSRTDTYKHSFFPSAIRLWNTLEPSAVTAPTLPVFKAEVKQWQSRHPK